MKGNAKHTSGTLLSLLEAQNKDIGTANIIIIYNFTIAPLQALLTDVKLHL